MQLKKIENVDTGLCDRFTNIIESHSIKGKEALKFFEIKSISVIGEIKNHVTEPSKKMIKKVAEKLGYSADWIILGRGNKKADSEIVTTCDNCDKMRDELENCKKELIKHQFEFAKLEGQLIESRRKADVQIIKNKGDSVFRKAHT